MNFITAFFMAWGNFITLPCPYKKWDNKLKNLMLSMLPSVGAVISVLFILINLAAVKLRVPDMVTAIIVEFYIFYIHGFMHLDGFMDCTDAIMSRRPLEDRQRIMKDPTVGSFAVGMVCFLLLGWFACYYTVLSTYPMLIYAVAFVPIISRSGAGAQVLTYKPIGHSQYVEDYKQEGRFKLKLVLAVQEALYLVAFLALMVRVEGIDSTFIFKTTCILAAAGCATEIAGMHARKQLGGMSGDIAGYSIVWGELAGVAAAAIATAY